MPGSTRELREKAAGINEEIITIREDHEREWNDELRPLNERITWQGSLMPPMLMTDRTVRELMTKWRRQGPIWRSSSKQWCDELITFPLWFLNDPELIEWTVNAIPLHWPRHLLYLVQDKKTNECQIIAFLVLLQGIPL